ncbi:uncharacterized protein [Amphiura filiformis]|uniref:uncharacterized protein n=1 Tax=Amphiura filiformis TaxID=82378 RepID=UPI003B21C0AB
MTITIPRTTLPAVGLLLILLCSVVQSAPAESQDTIKAEDKELAKNAPGDILSEDQSNEFGDVNIDQLQEDALQELPQGTSGEIDSEEDSDEDNDDYSIVEPNNLKKDLEDNSEESFTYNSHGDSYENNVNPEESSFFKSSYNDFDFMANYDDKDGKDDRKLEELLCAVLDMCDFTAAVGTPQYQWENSDYSDVTSDNNIKIDAEPLPKFKNNDVDKPNYRMKRSVDNDNSKHGHRAKRDLSWDDEDDDDIVPLDVLAEVLANDNPPIETPRNNLIDVLDYIEGIRKDRMTAGDILDEFEVDEAMGGVPFEVDDSDTDTVFRKRGATARDMKHFVERLPTLEGMKKRSDRRLNYDDLNDIDIVAAENELAAKELQNIEIKAQVAAAMLDNAAMLISVIENMAVELVGEYLGLEDEDDFDDNHVEFDEFPQYLPPVPPVSVEKRVGREREYRYPAAYDYPFAPEDMERPFKGAYETESKPRVWHPPTGYSRPSSYRRPSTQNKYRNKGRQPVPPPFLGNHIGIFLMINIYACAIDEYNPFKMTLTLSQYNQTNSHLKNEIF